jgi:hypothetical protein
MHEAAGTGQGASMSTALRLGRSRTTMIVVAAPLVAALAACGSSGSGSSTTSAGTGSPAVSTSSGAATASPSSSGDASVAAVIGGWAAQYGTARNTVLASLDALGSAASAAEVKKAAGDALAAVKDAGSLAPCPDAATDTAYRAALTDLTSKLEQIQASGDQAAAKALADASGDVFSPTEDALSAAYS